MHTSLKGKKVAILATDMFEEVELIEPKKALEAAGAETIIISDKPGNIQAANHFDKSKKYHVDKTFDQIKASDFDAVLLPGGVQNADAIRIIPAAQKFIKAINSASKPIAVICHGSWLLVSAGLAKGRHLTSYQTLKDDIKNAGGSWTNESVVKDKNWVSSRKPDDIPKFNQAMIALIAK